MLQTEATVLTMPSPREPIPYARVACGLSYALDMASENSPGHALRTCILGMKLGRRIGLKQEELGSLYYALLFKDIGYSGEIACSLRFREGAGAEARMLLRDGVAAMPKRRAASAVRALYREDATIRGVHALVTRGAAQQALRRSDAAQRRRLAVSRAHSLGLDSAGTEALAYVDAQWDGNGYPKAKETAITTLAQIVKLAQTLDHLYELYRHRETIETIYGRCRGWFDPGLVAATMFVFHSEESWSDLQQPSLAKYVAEQEPMHWSERNGLAVERLCDVLAEVVDSRSSHMEGHSRRVANVSVQIGKTMGLQAGEIATLHRAALLHNLGMLGVSPLVINKEETLTEGESAMIRMAPLEAARLLSQVPGFREVALVTSSQHERLNGTGYPFGLRGDSICMMARILAVANVTEALASPRAYRGKLSAEQIYDAVDALTPHAIDADCVKALRLADVLSMVA
jgi:HD-GYP domain-containing protein (c-di-GMP phosphodiesterase class II)